ncbi:MobC family plasmid mobilization relaxosome protein [Capnocytophaga felis]|nr:MobC family plasmid mobilization relaxosome protein [Capnocytophaga felis]
MKTIENRNTNGRPPKRPVEKKKYKVTLKMATEEFYSLKAKVRLAGITRSEYVCRCIAASIVRQRLSSELMSHLRQLSGMANNVNQIAHKANAMGYARVYQDNLAMTERLDNIIKRIEDDC